MKCVYGKCKIVKNKVILIFVLYIICQCKYLIRKIVFLAAIMGTILVSIVPIVFISCITNFTMYGMGKLPRCDKSVASYTNYNNFHYKIAIVTFSDTYIGNKLVQKSIANKAAYATAWNIDLKAPSRSELENFDWFQNGQIDNMKRSKFAYVQKILPFYDAVLWMDIDAIIMRQDVNLHQVFQEMLNENKSVAMTQDRHLTNMLNSGVIMFRNHPPTYEFLDEFMKAHSLIIKCRKMRVCYSQMYDQNIISYLINRWPSCGVGLFGRIIHHYSPVHPNWTRFNKIIQEWPICTFNCIPEETTNATFVQHCYGVGLKLQRLTLDGKRTCMSRALIKTF